MLNRKEFIIASRKFSPIISVMINSNQPYYDFGDVLIRWKFIDDDNVSNVATYNKDEDIILINLRSLMLFDNYSDLPTVEYYFLYAIRKFNQSIFIKSYKKYQRHTSKDIVDKWIYEYDHPLDIKDNKHYYQEIEIDAYAYAYSVMKFKYKDVSKLYLPKPYKKELKVHFNELVDKWIKEFLNEKENH